MPSDVLPYFRPSSTTLRWGPWELWLGEAWGPLPEQIEGWDSGTDLIIRRALHVNVTELPRETLVEVSDVRATLSWVSSTTRMTEASQPILLDPDGHCTLQATLIGSKVSGTLTLRSTLALVRPPKSIGPGVAHLPGSVLGDESRSLILEDALTRFPVHEIDFAETSLPTDASWHLETSTDLHAPFLGTFQLLLNRRDTELCAAVRNPKDRRALALSEELQSGIAALMLEIAVRERDDLVEQDWPADSVGDVLHGILTNASMEDDVFPESSGMARFRTRIAHAVRASGQGRQFT